MPPQERHTLKTCDCGKTYTREEWQALEKTHRHNGVLTMEDGFTYEFRHCSGCQSTLAITLRHPSSRSLPALPSVVRAISQPPRAVAASAMLRVSRSDK